MLKRPVFNDTRLAFPRNSGIDACVIPHSYRRASRSNERTANATINIPEIPHTTNSRAGALAPCARKPLIKKEKGAVTGMTNALTDRGATRPLGQKVSWRRA